MTTARPPADAIARLAFSEADLARFLAKIDTSGECWIWTGSNNGRGYGQFHKTGPDGRRQRYAHRLSYELFVGPIPDGMTLDHRCERGANGCVTPMHLRPMSMGDNVLRSTRSPLAQKARQTQCIRGHPLGGDNLLIVETKGRRQSRRCRTCRDLRNAARDPEVSRRQALAWYYRHRRPKGEQVHS
jgi:hypothetical protein